MSCVGASGRDADWEKTGIRRGFEEKHPSLWLSLLRGDRKAETPRGTREPERSRVYQSQYLSFRSCAASPWFSPPSLALLLIVFHDPRNG